MFSNTGPFIHEHFDVLAARSPSLPFLITRETTWTLGDLGVLTTTLEQELRNCGVVRGDRVLILAENCPEHVALILACSRVGAWSCGVNARMSEDEINAYSDKADPRVVYFTTTVSASARGHASAFAAVPSVVPTLMRSATRHMATAELGALAHKVASIIFTSGTTGQPKGVLVTHEGLLQFARVSAKSRALMTKDRVYAYLPMTHIFGLGTILMASLFSGAALVMRSKFDPADLFYALEHDSVSMLQGPPAMFVKLLGWFRQQGITEPVCPALRYIYVGAAPLDIGLKQTVETYFKQPMHHGYGLSEYAGALCLVRTGVTRQDTSAGYVVDGAELRIVDSEGKDVAKNERGEIWMRGVGLTPGYFRDQQATDMVMRPGGWYASGDLGFLDHDAALTVVGRLKEMIIRSGFNVYPGEVELVLSAFPDIERVAVVGRLEVDGNEEIVAFIEAVSNKAIDLTALQAYAAGSLAPYKRPSRILQVDTFPMTISGKVLKRKLIELLSLE